MSAAGRTTNDPANYISIGLQSAKDSAATVFYDLKHLDGSGFDVAVEIGSERVGGSGREVGLRYRKKVTADGQIVAYAQPDFLGRILALALGTDTVTAGPSQGSGNAYYSTHALATGGSLLPYATIQQLWADEAEEVTNALFSSVKIEGEAQMPIKVTAQFISGGTPFAFATTHTPVREAAFPIMYTGASVSMTANYQSTPGSASSVQLTKYSLEIKNQLDGDIQTTGLQREDVLWLNLDCDLDGTIKYINDAFWNEVQYGGQSQVPVGVLTTGAFNFYQQNPSAMSLSILMPALDITNVKVNRLDPDGKTMYLDFTASTKGGTGTNSFQATVISGASTAYTSSTT